MRFRLGTPRRAVQLLLLTLGLAVASGCSGGGGTADPGSTDPGGDSGTPGGDDDVALPRKLDVTLHVEEFAGVARRGEPVRSGVPVPRAIALTDASTLEVVGPDGQVIPSQVRVTSRWGGAPDDPSRPIKWLLVDFPADVDANAHGIFRLRTGSGTTGTQSMVVDQGASLLVDTGAARFTISKGQFRMFDRVELENGAVLSGPSSDSGIYLQTPNGTRHVTSGGTSEVRVEEDGAIRTVVVARGKHVAGAVPLLDWTVRMEFWKGRADALVRYTFTERDKESIREYVALDEVGVTLPISVGEAPRYTFGTDGAPLAAALSGEAWLRQTGNLTETMSSTFDPGTPDTIRWSAGGVASGGGGHAPGWVDVSGKSGGVSAAMRWFWEQYPKKIAVRPDALTFEIWPSEDVNLRVYAAAQKTHEILYTFHDGSDGATAGKEAWARMSQPLFARCNPSWYARTYVWGRIGVEVPAAYPEEWRGVVEAYFADLREVQYPATFVELRNDAKGRGHSYSMWDFGDGREAKWSNGAYDTPRSLLMHWAITGERAFLDRGLEAALHFRDVDIEHSPKDTRAHAVSGRGVPMPFLGRTRYNPSEGPQSHDHGYEGRTGFGFEHHKGQSLADHYFLTGDMLSKEVLAETYHYFEQWKVDAENGFLRDDGSRTVSHMLLVLLGYHDAYGTPESRDRIEYVVRYLHDWQRRTEPKDPDGWIWLTGAGKTSAFMNAVTAEALMQYENAFPDGQPVRDDIVDAARWTVDPKNGQLASGGQGEYFNAWSGNNYGVSHATVLDPMMGPWLAYAADATGDPAIRDLASRVLLNAIEHDASSPYVKAFTQRTKLVPAFLFFLQTPEARAEAGSQGVAP